MVIISLENKWLDFRFVYTRALLHDPSAAKGWCHNIKKT